MEKEKIHLSDCAVHNEPAMPNGDCDCVGLTLESFLRNWLNADSKSFTGVESEYVLKAAVTSKDNVHIYIRGMNKSVGTLDFYVKGNTLEQIVPPTPIE